MWVRVPPSPLRAVSSAGERLFHTQEVVGSNPTRPTPGFSPPGWWSVSDKHVAQSSILWCPTPSSTGVTGSTSACQVEGTGSSPVWNSQVRLRSFIRMSTRLLPWGTGFDSSRGYFKPTWRNWQRTSLVRMRSWVRVPLSALAGPLPREAAGQQGHALPARSPGRQVLMAAHRRRNPGERVRISRWPYKRARCNWQPCLTSNQEE